MASFRSFRRRSLNFFPSKSFRREFSVETLSWQPLPRSASLARLAREEFDVVVVGGGCVGAGVAWEASTRGLKVALLEQGDFSSGTSSRSTKLIHGGIRYLESAFKNLDKGMYDLVTEALDERAHLLNAAPYMAKPMATLVPISSWWEIPYVWMGTKVYDAIAGDSGVPGSYYISRADALASFPGLNPDTLKAGIVYHDGTQNDSRMNIMIAATAERAGATLANYCGVGAVLKDATTGRARGVQAVDSLTGARFSVRGKTVVNATGCFGDALRLMDTPSAAPLIQGSAGVHIMLPRGVCPRDLGLIVPKTRDGRVLFILPWEGHTLAGTTDSSCAISTAPLPAAQDVAFILSECNRYLSTPLDATSVLSAWSGIRPLIKDPSAEARGLKGTAGLSRTHVIEVSPTGMLSILGGKWTTYRRMAEEAIDRLANENPGVITPTRSVTSRARVLGAMEGGGGTAAPAEQEHLAALLTQSPYSLPKDVAAHLVGNYGDRAELVGRIVCGSGDARDFWGRRFSSRLSPHHPFIAAEVVYAVRCEYALSIEDVLARRTRLAFLDTEAAQMAVDPVGALMAEILGWSEERRAQEIASALSFLDTMHSEPGAVVL